MSVAAQVSTTPLRLTLKLGATTAVAYSSNPRLSAPDGAGRGADVSVQFSPSVTLSTRGPLLDANVQYASTAVSFAAAPQDHSVVHSLRSAARMHVAQDRLSVDASAQYTQQAASAFGNPIMGAGSFNAGGVAVNALNPNIVDVMSLQVSPVLRMRVADAATVESRYVATRLQTSSSATPEGPSQTGHAVQAAVFGGDVLGWSLQATNQWQEFPSGRELQSGRAVAGLSYPVMRELVLRMSAGVERQNLQAATLPSDAIRVSRYLQAGGTWMPSARSSASLDVTDRFFGTGWQLGLNHRFSRLAMRVGASRALNDGPLTLSTVGPQLRDGSSFSLADLYDRILAVGEPDAARRDEAVARLLKARGLDGDARVVGLSQSLGPVIQERLEFGMAYVLPRQSFNLVAVRSSSESVLRDPLDPSEDLARFGGMTQTIVQAGMSHRLTPDSALTLSLGHFRADAVRVARPVQMTQAELNGSFRLGPRLTGMLVLRDAELLNPNLASTSLLGAARRRDTGLAFFLVPQF